MIDRAQVVIARWQWIDRDVSAVAHERLLEELIWQLFDFREKVTGGQS